MASVQDVQNQIIGMSNAYRDPTSGAVDWQSVLPQITQWAKQNNIDPGLLAQAGQAINPNYGWDVNKVQQTEAQYGPKPTDYGLSAAYGTLNQGAADATQRIGQTQGQVSDLYKQGLQMLQPYQAAGGQANQVQAALSGALGPEAQQKAFADYQSSPGIQWAQQQGEQSILRNAAATGGLGGGNVLKALQSFGTGLALQDYNNAFGRLGTVADRGLSSATTGAGLQGQQAGIQSGLGQFAANIPMQTASQLGGLQYQAGRDISSNIGATTSSLANLISGQGAGMTDIYGNTTNNINSLYQQAMGGNAQAMQQLATLLAQTGMQGSGQFAGVSPITPSTPNYMQQLGQGASAIGTGLTAYNLYNKPSTGSTSAVYSAANTNPGYGPSYNTPYNPVYNTSGLQ